ncbi:MAG: zinc-binding alcohol dehydrogenase family protein [Verrucomicrobiota bacterium]
MQALQITAPHQLRLVEVPEPRPQEDEALLAVRRVGICGTDWHAFGGSMPFFEYPRIIGHELGVEVLELPRGYSGTLKTGDRCSVEPYLNDPGSQASALGKTNCCESLRVLGVHMDGGLQPMLTMPAHKLHASASLSFDQLALVETLCIGAHAIERARPGRDDRILIVGAGPIGLGALQFARLESETIAVMDVNPSRLDFCNKELGIEKTLLATDEPVEALRELFDGLLPTIVIDATGHQGSMEKSFSLLSNGGTLVFLGIFAGPIAFHDPEFHRRELTVMASRNATAATFQHVITSIESGRVSTDPWITHRIPFEESVTQLPLLEKEPGLLKAMVGI